MKLDPVVRRETVFMAVSVFICSVLLQAGFFLFGKWDYTVLLGGIVGWGMSVGNFFLMSLNVQRAVECGDENQAKMKINASYTWRMTAMLGIMIVTFILDAIHWLPVVAAVFYPRIVITVRQLWQKFVLKIPEEVPSSPVPAADEQEDDEDTEEDAFEKALGHFARKINTDYSAADASASGDAAADDEEKGRS